ncbi:non-canonical poly(A) RNA polymerase protein Trf4-1-like isoform X2 [Varroa destructor]|uniref:polynucleotide adenylyltransferase n=1 Tax=Varroa destructor TaxID=109461 RepID=A0A7M7J9J9_VARDE|nr:non-canonical poly(A) RNA polymerase protein Trf4-1-like isoform X2 [Varroa destructor]
MSRDQIVASKERHGSHNGVMPHNGHHYTNQGHHGISHHSHYNNNNQHSNNDMNGHGNHHNGNSNNRNQAWGFRARGANRPRPDNIGSTQNIYQYPHCVARFGGLPWKKPERQYKPGVEGLTEEIEDFFKYITPTSEEHAARESIVNQLKELITAKWPEAELHVFGSFRTNLYLPTGDIDLGSWGDIPPLFDLERFLVEQGFCERSTLRVLDKATVPLIKFRDRKTDIAVDISLNQVNCIKAADYILDSTKRFPCLSPLTMVLKQFLSERNLNEVFFGGLSSYSLVLMIITFLQIHEKQEMVTSEKPNLGQLLLDFLYFFGIKFEYEIFGLRVKQGGKLVKKEDLRRDMVYALAGAINPAQVGINPSPQCMLTIEDPVTPGNDVARASYSVGTIKEEFRLAYNYLQKGVIEERDPTHSILGRIIRVTDPVVYQRLRIRHCQRNPDLRAAANNNNNGNNNNSFNQEIKDMSLTYDNNIATVTTSNNAYSRMNSTGNHKNGGNNRSNGVHNGCSPGRKSGVGPNKRRNNSEVARESSSSAVISPHDNIAAGGDSHSTVCSPSGTYRRPATPTCGPKDIALATSHHHSRQKNKDQNKNLSKNHAVSEDSDQTQDGASVVERANERFTSDSAFATEDSSKTASAASGPTTNKKTSKDLSSIGSFDIQNGCANEKKNEKRSSHSASNNNDKQNICAFASSNQTAFDSLTSDSSLNWINESTVATGCDCDGSSITITATGGVSESVNRTNHHAASGVDHQLSTGLIQHLQHPVETIRRTQENHLEEQEIFDRIILGDVDEP